MDEDCGLDQNIAHMDAAHGFSIPNSAMIEDLEEFVTYLVLEVCVWHECLYCGAVKQSTESIQNHMRDKSHCLLNFDREPELWGFWTDRAEDHDSTDSQPPATISTTEMRFTSGKVVASRHAAPTPKRSTTRLPSQALIPRAVSAESPSPELLQPTATSASNSRQLARREELSITGISTQQRQALVLAEKKAQRSEASARRAREWVYAKSGNLQKHDQIDTTAKKGKQNHKLQPR